ncbi:cadherin EGF LAG seven-pass G-type receptor 3-like [Dreissena polymorpha]|uniref:cadherin EGF LAG seven-pass G-type receptor 3-like n=1 Tax=Dreissena polymorpha TaxID=45954 RepID=UPI0022654B77|nr:cadherin EGF LAG seven-pass G-type receptor 3-like [Dreissena polymorpha]
MATDFFMNGLVILCALILPTMAVNKCTNNKQFGVTNLNNNYNRDPGTTTGVQYLVPDGIDCCGVIDNFDAIYERTGTLYFQIWRPSTNGHTIIGQWSTADPNGYFNTGWINPERCGYNNQGTERITVLPGDLYGWWTAGEEIISYDDTADTVYEAQLTGSPGVGTEIAWPMGTTTTNRRYGIRVQVDQNNNPSFSDLPTSTNVFETVATGTSIWKVTPSDNDVSDASSLTVTMATNTYFNFDPNNLVVSVSSSLISVPDQTLSFTVTDQCGNTGTEDLTVVVVNIAPVIQNLPNSTSLHENTVTYEYVYTVSVVDYGPVTCAINPASSNFLIRQAGASSAYWDIYTVSGCNFNYATGASIALNVKCTDTGGKSDTETFTVNLIQNEPPIIHNLPNSTSVHEDSDVETLIYVLNVTDADSPSLTCVFVTASTLFRLRMVTGGTKWGIYSVAGATFDYNAKNSYQLDVNCADERASDVDVFTVYLIRNDPPQLTNVPANISLSTSAPIGYDVYNVTSFDTPGADGRANQLTYTITCVPTDCPFTILASGMLQLNMGITTLSLVGYDVSIKVCDHRNCGDIRILTVNIVEINDLPEITNLNQNLNVPENSATSHVLLTTACTDFDVPDDTLSYSMTCSPGTGNNMFFINSGSGQIRTASTIINYETLAVKSFTCTITCSDGLALDTATLNIDVTDVNENPAFTQAAFSVNVDEGPGGTLLLASGLSSTDPDVPETKLYSLDCNPYTGYFAINSGSGALSYATNYDVDPAGGMPTKVQCTVTVTDSGGLTDTASISITINNINDNAPTFLPAFYSYFADGAAPVSTNKLSPDSPVSVTDGDLGAFGQITYSLNQSSLGDQYFGITQSGEIFVTKAISVLGYGSTVSFEVVASDGGGRSSRATVSVVVMATTTTSTTTTTDRYRTFFEDSRNIAWFVPAVALAAAGVGLSAYMALTYCKSTGPAFKLACRCCKIEKVYSEARRYDVTRLRPRNLPTPKPKAFEFWHA